MKRFTWVISVAGAYMLLAACGGSSSKSSSAASGGSSTQASSGAGAVGGKLVIDNVSGSTWTCQFNPFNSSLLGPGITFALIYEPLQFVNILQANNAPTPML